MQAASNSRTQNRSRADSALSTFTFSASKKFQKPVEVIPSSAPTLSLGHWQKLALARSELRQAPLLAILDEPTASLDPRAEQQLFERYSATARSSSGQGTITLLVSHRFSTVRMADLILVLRSGEVAEAGSHEELMAGGGIYARLFQLQAAAYAWPSRWLLPGGWSDAGRNVLLHVDGSPLVVTRKRWPRQSC